MVNIAHGAKPEAALVDFGCPGLHGEGWGAGQAAGSFPPLKSRKQESLRLESESPSTSERLSCSSFFQPTQQTID
jgi:hypothetical protein